MKKITLLLVLFCATLFSLQAQTPLKNLNYQAVIRNNTGNVLENQFVSLRIGIYQDTLPLVIMPVYQEIHLAKTNQFGMINLLIGKGAATKGIYDTLEWKNKYRYIKIELDPDAGTTFKKMGYVQLQTVPYAQVALDVINKPTLGELSNVNTAGATSGQVLKFNGTNWTPATDATSGGGGGGSDNQTLSLSGNILSIANGNSVTLPTGTTYTAGSGIAVSGNTITNTGDLSNTNEIQTMTLSGNVLNLSNGGGSVTLPSGGGGGTTYTAGAGIDITGNVIKNTGDADASPTNEIQSLTLAGNVLNLSNGGGSVTLPAGSGSDSQTLTVAGNQLTITNGNSVTLPTGTTYTAGSGINIAGNTITATDNSATNEIQTMTLVGNTLNLSNGGGSVTLPSGGGGGTTYTAGAGIDISGNVIKNTGDTNASDDLTTSSSAGGDVLGTFNDLKVVKIYNFPVNPVAPTTNQVLKWDGSKWSPAADATGASGGVSGSGSGTIGSLTRWVGPNTLDDSALKQDVEGNIGLNVIPYTTYKMGIKSTTIANRPLQLFSDNTSGGGIHFAMNDAAQYADIELRTAVTDFRTTSSKLALNAKAASLFPLTADHFSIYNNGNVTLGLFDPMSSSDLLSVRGNIGIKDGSYNFYDNSNNATADIACLSPSNKLHIHSIATNAGIEMISTGGKIEMATNGIGGSSSELVVENGKVTIGNGAATQPKLEVLGQVKINGGTPGAGKVLTSDAAGLATWQTPAGGGGGQWTTVGNNIKNANTGVVQVATTVPGEALTITAPSDAYMSIYEGANYRGYIGSYSGAAEDVDFGTGSGTVGKTHLVTASIPRLTVDATGNVGIGTTTPVTKLDIVGNAGLSISNTGQTRSMVYSPSTTNDLYFTGGNANITTGAANSTLILQRWPDTKVAIGDITPTTKLDIDGQIRIRGGSPSLGKVLTSTADGTATWETPAAGGGGQWTTVGNNLKNANTGVVQIASTVSSGEVLSIAASSGAYMSIYEGANYRGYLGSYSGAAEDVDFGTGGGATGKTHLVTGAIPRLTVDATGKVGIGTQTPTQPLQMVSGAFCSAAGIWTNASDRRLKKNISTMNYGLKEVMLLQPVAYDMRADETKQVGFIAQDVQKIIPELISGTEGDLSKGENLGMSYGNLTAVLTKAIQEQQAMIIALQKEVAELKKR